MQTASFFLIVAFGGAHVFRRGDRRWVGAASLEGGSEDAVGLLEHNGRPLVLVCGGALYPTHLSHRVIDVAAGLALWAHMATVGTEVVPLRHDGRLLVSRSIVGKYGHSRDVLDPLTGAPVRDVSGFSGGGRLVGSGGGSLYAFVDGSTGEVRVYRDGARLATLRAPTDPPPTVSTMAFGGRTYTVIEAPIRFSPRMQVYLDEAGGILTAADQQADGYGLDGAHTHRMPLPEDAKLQDATWTAEDGWLLLVTRGEVAAVCRLRDGAVLLERPAARQPCFADGAVLREGLVLTDARTGEALPPLELPPTEALPGRLPLDAPGLYGDRLTQIISPLRARGRIDVDPVYQRFDITPADIRQPATRATYSAGPLPAPRPLRRALAELARWTRGDRIAMTAAELAAHEQRRGVPFPAEALPLFASGLPYLLVEGKMHPDRAAQLRRWTEDVPEDLTPLAAFFHDLDAELTVVWAYRFTASGVAFFRVDRVRGTRGSGIREESFTAVFVTGPLPLHTLVSEEAARVAYDARDRAFFFREPERPPVPVTIRLG